MRSPMQYEDPVCADIKGVDQLFYPETSVSSVLVGIYAEARRLCNACQHINECAEWGINYELHGVWGGLSPKEREQIRKRKRIPRTAPPGESEVIQLMVKDR